MDNNKNSNRYAWTRGLCKVFEERLGVESTIYNDEKLGRYMCKFSFGEKQFYLLGARDGTTVAKLKYTDEILDKKRKESEKIFNNIKAKGILP